MGIHASALLPRPLLFVWDLFSVSRGFWRDFEWSVQFLILKSDRLREEFFVSVSSVLINLEYKEFVFGKYLFIFELLLRFVPSTFYSCELAPWACELSVDFRSPHASLQYQIFFFFFFGLISIRTSRKVLYPFGRRD